jgi:hypothetical protein
MLHPRVVQGVNSALTDEEIERFARAFLVAGDVGLLELVSGTTTLEVGNGAFVFICSLIERSKAYWYCCQ